MLIGGREVEGERAIPVLNPFDGSEIDTVPAASEEQVDHALSTAVEGARIMERMSRFDRAEILARASRMVGERIEELALTMASEVGKTLREARGEISRTVQTLAVSAEEARRLAGEVVPFDGAPTGKDRFGFYIRVPVGVVLAITPFNFPVNLAAHKIAPAFAAGNAVILKPATVTPLTDIAFGKILYEAGLPPEALSVITGSGSTVGDRLVSSPVPRMVTFTGSVEIGKAIMSRAGLKKTAMELGSNSAVIVTANCDVGAAAERSARAGYALAGQVCISVQRVLVEETVLDRFLEAAANVTASLELGDQLDEATDVGPMIEEGEAERAESWIEEARSMGASLVAGGGREGALLEPTILTGVPDEARVWKDEAFAPVIAVRPFGTLDEAIDHVNRSRYGLQTGVYTDRLDDALRAAREIRCGGVMVNDVPTFRVDLMPYGGEKESGLGREGPKFAVEEMTEIRVVGIRGPAR
jgi:acyl-CoA reductase-like NAD-dependent aldehyde dehydrogenase